MQDRRMGLGLAGSGTTNPFDGDFHITSINHTLLNDFCVDENDVNKLRPGDRIVRLNNFPVYGNSHKQALDLIRFLRSNAGTFRMLVKRRFSPLEYLSKLNHFVTSVNFDAKSLYPGFTVVCQHYDPDNSCILPAIASVSESNNQLMPDDIVTHLDEECLIGLSLNEIRCLIGVIIGEKAKNHDKSLKLHVYRKVLQPNFNRSFIYMQSTPDQLYSKYKLDSVALVKSDAFMKFPLRFFDTRWRFVRDEPQIMVFYEKNLNNKNNKRVQADYNVANSERGGLTVDGCNMVVSIDGRNCFQWSPEHFEEYMNDSMQIRIVYISNLKPSEITDIHYFVIKSYKDFYGYFEEGGKINDCGEVLLSSVLIQPVKQMFVKTLVSYDNNKDKMNPGVGLSYDLFETLFCLNGSDRSWWQCARVYYDEEKNLYCVDENNVGIVPSEQEMNSKRIKKSKRVSFGNMTSVMSFDSDKTKIKKKKANGLKTSKSIDVMDLDEKMDKKSKRRPSCMRGEKPTKNNPKNAFYEEVRQVRLTADNCCRPVVIGGSQKNFIIKNLLQNQQISCGLPNYTVTPNVNVTTNGVAKNTMTLTEMLDEHSVGKLFAVKWQDNTCSAVRYDEFVEKSRNNIHILFEYDENTNFNYMVKNGVYPIFVVVGEREEIDKIVEKEGGSVTGAVETNHNMVEKVVEVIKLNNYQKTVFIRSDL